MHNDVYCCMQRLKNCIAAGFRFRFLFFSGNAVFDYRTPFTKITQTLLSSLIVIAFMLVFVSLLDNVNIVSESCGIIDYFMSQCQKALFVSVSKCKTAS